MKQIFSLFFSIVILIMLQWAAAQQGVHPQSSTYEWPTEPEVKANLVETGETVKW